MSAAAYLFSCCINTIMPVGLLGRRERGAMIGSCGRPLACPSSLRKTRRLFRRLSAQGECITCDGREVDGLPGFVLGLALSPATMLPLPDSSPHPFTQAIVESCELLRHSQEKALEQSLVEVPSLPTHVRAPSGRSFSLDPRPGKHKESIRIKALERKEVVNKANALVA